jgi:hypothetical protein
MSFESHWRLRASRLPALFANNARTVGVLEVPTGRLVVAQGVATSSTDDFVPFARQTPTGLFPVEVTLAKSAKGEERIAAVRIMFSPQPIADWEEANGPELSGTTGVMMDMQAVAAFQSFADEHVEWWYDVKSTKGDGWQYGCFEPNKTDNVNVAFFSMGEYEGTYQSYWALDGSEMPVMLVTDFNVAP